jgi:hypothetical protein
MQPQFESIRLAAQMREQQLRADAARFASVPKPDIGHNERLARLGWPHTLVAGVVRAVCIAIGITAVRRRQVSV